MRQVPSFKQYALLGNGRAAKHFSYYLETLQLPFWVWTDARSFTPDFFDRLAETSHVILLVSDSALRDVALRIRSHPRWLLLPEESRPQLLHASGATEVEGVVAAHPLMTFPGNRLYAKDFYTRIPITLFGQPDELDAARLLPGLPNPVHVLPRDAQPLYHALCVSFGNLPQLLWSETEALRARSFPIPLDSFRPFLEASLQNFLAEPERSLTGPFVRRDRATVERHLQALAGSSLLPIYSAFVNHFLPRKEDAPCP